MKGTVSHGFYWEWMLEPAAARQLCEGVDAALSAAEPLQWYRTTTAAPPADAQQIQEFMAQMTGGVVQAPADGVGPFKLEMLEAPPAPFARVEVDVPIEGRALPGPAEMVAFLGEKLAPWASRNPGYRLSSLGAPCLTGQERSDAPEGWTVARVELVPREERPRLLLLRNVVGP